MKATPTDAYKRPCMLGDNNGETVPLKASPTGILQTAITNPIKYQLVEVLKLDLSIARTQELFQIQFDSIAVGDLEQGSSFFMHINNKTITINKCLSMDVTNNNIKISNETQSGFAELWFYKII